MPKLYKIFDFFLISLDLAVSVRAVGKLSSEKAEAWPQQLGCQ